ncbi:hypothetical protein [Compostimonas suwonensis]|uniref:Uncharacterized protein n=1 Tax=Compostimonas suwonensis TaxID=1048394 RepID=A0A2M9C3U3_9MICO|nr:hypothetical protein [Compostimonas suwonensis]PJJ65200.1 hypothetical protein CLV54_0229 [Compostimonas suwonensis]
MSTKSRQGPHREEVEHIPHAGSGWWGVFAGVITLTIVSVPLSAAFAFATNPNTQQLFAGRLADDTQLGYSLFWWAVTILLLALPFLVGFGIASLRGKGLGIAAGIIALFVVVIVVLGRLYVF